ncbi:hydrolase [Tolypocladium capitatum]|uniref:Hydrolase n=1 Tax=Tolypocladium capitatum TaxID=45235 RepID=A0A2K3Q2Y5_9HYPO|nr:hydrolase [Tolypocladium capitatum]
MTSITTSSTIDVDGTNVFYRQSGPSDAAAPSVLLLHGFPSSSHQFRNLIPLLASKGYRVIAPDLPGFGFTTVPDSYTYSFANLAGTIDGFVSALGLRRFAVYIFDYGAPTGLRLALKRPDQVVAIVSQNGNAYEEGFGAEFWAPLRKYWASGAKEDRDALRGALEIGVTKWQYTDGSPHPDKIQPETYYLDQALMGREGNKEVQLDLFYDYRNNIELYPAFHEYFRKSKVPVLAIWGKNDTIFIPPGAEAYRRDVEKTEVRFVDAGHFALETNEQEFAEAMHAFFENFKVF